MKLKAVDVVVVCFFFAAFPLLLLVFGVDDNIELEHAGRKCRINIY